MMTEREKMLSGSLYDPEDPELVQLRLHARQLLYRYNQSRPTDIGLRNQLLQELLQLEGRCTIEPPFFCDYGSNIYVGDAFFANFNCTMLDVCRIDIGHHVMFGPQVQLYTATHPLKSSERNSGRELGAPIHIGDEVWLGGGVIICPGVRIGNRSTVGAGSVVIRDIPEDVFAAGNPCRVIRNI